MSSRILTTDFSGLDDFMQDHAAVLAKSASGAVAVFANNAPAFYALTPERLAQLLELEAKLARPNSDIALDAQFLTSRRRPRCGSDGEISDVRRLAAGCGFSAPGRAVGHRPEPARYAGRVGGICRLLAG